MKRICPYCGYDELDLVFLGDNRKAVLCMVCGFHGPSMKSQENAIKSFELNYFCNSNCPYFGRFTDYCVKFNKELFREKGISSEKRLYFRCEECR